jgi:hypothetical protein
MVSGSKIRFTEAESICNMLPRIPILKLSANRNYAFIAMTSVEKDPQNIHYFVLHLRCSYPFHAVIPTLRSGLCTAASSRLFSLRFQLRLIRRPANYGARRAGSKMAQVITCSYTPHAGRQARFYAKNQEHRRCDSFHILIPISESGITAMSSIGQ